jgi:cobalt transporter subunit CbtB
MRTAVGRLLERIMASPIAAASSTTAVGTRQRSAAVGAMLLGSALLFLVGFAPMPVVHNAAHDTRHSAAFPCH